ncbi:MAG: hypothetical protein HYU36_10870 [Planctomycetes bacterium]|nr:hypothetical protein [Planctomycetota bacterium]
MPPQNSSGRPRARGRRVVLSLLAGLCLLDGPARGQQTTNHVLHAVPPPGKVQIDGQLDDWDLSGQIEVFANYRMKTSYSARVAAMHDPEHFYLAILWRDATPLFNKVDPRFDLGSGWRSDCLQLRVRTDMTLHVDAWYSAACDRPVLRIAYGRYGWKKGDPEGVPAFTGLDDALAAGAAEAFRQGDDGKSYVQEISLPWRLITGQAATVRETGQPYKPPRSYAAGDSFNMGMEFLWGGPDGRSWPIHRYADLLREGQTSREFFWTSENAWGSVKLEPKGNLQLPKADVGPTDLYLQKTEGPVALQYRVPFDGFVTLVIENEQGVRVKNLIGMAQRAQGDRTDFWDCTDEQGRLVAPGAYRWRGLFHQGIEPTYRASYGTAGIPPWDNADNTGAWMSDHSPPVAVAASRGMMILAAGGGEAGWAMIGTDLDGRKKWGERKFQGIRAVAADESFLYAGMNGHASPPPPPSVGRLQVKSGQFAPFQTTGEPLLIVPVATQEEKATLTGLAVSPDRLAVSLAGPDVVRFFDKATVKPLGDVPVPKPAGLAFDGRGTLHVISGAQVVKIEGEKPIPWITSDLDQPFDMALDGQGQAFVTDHGSHQIKVFGPDGRFLRTIGQAGGRRQPGLWQPQNLRNPSGIDLDEHGRLWVAEGTLSPKRISVWTPEGQLVRDFLGPTGYGGSGACADLDDKTRLFGVGCEFHLDYESGKAVPVAVRLVEGMSGELLKFNDHEYLMGKRGVLYIRRGEAFVPAARFGTAQVKNLKDVPLPLTPPPVPIDPPGTPRGSRRPPPPEHLPFLWSDANDDGVGQVEEIAANLPYVLGNGHWGGYWLDESFNLYSCQEGLRKIPLKGWTPGGVPLWDVSQQKLILSREVRLFHKLYLARGGRVIAGSPFACVREDGSILWTYKDAWSDVHGSHAAPIPERDDVLVGTLSCIGLADTETTLGHVFAMNSNMGRLYLMTMDGLFLASVFQDTRTGAVSWPAEALPGVPLGGGTMGSEWFGGYFFKARKTQEYYLIAGGTSYNLIQLHGFDTLRPIEGGGFAVSAQDLQTSEQLLQKRAAEQATPRTLTLSRLAQMPAVDGKLDEFPKTSFVEWSSGPYRARAAVAAAAEHLCLAYEVWGDGNPMVNGGKDFTHLFISGDSLDLQLGADADADPGREQPVVGDLRLLLSVFDNKPAAVLYRWKVPGTKQPVTFSSPWRSHTVDSVSLLADAVLSVGKGQGSYTFEAAIPLKSLDFSPQPGKSYKIDLGVIYSDATGNNRAARVYWSNKATGLTADVPGEIMASPRLWGTAEVQP